MWFIVDLAREVFLDFRISFERCMYTALRFQVDSQSIAGVDGRIKEGDHILQVSSQSSGGGLRIWQVGEGGKF